MCGCLVGWKDTITSSTMCCNAAKVIPAKCIFFLSQQSAWNVFMCDKYDTKYVGSHVLIYFALIAPIRIERMILLSTISFCQPGLLSCEWHPMITEWTLSPNDSKMYDSLLRKIKKSAKEIKTQRRIKSGGIEPIEKLQDKIVWILWTGFHFVKDTPLQVRQSTLCFHPYLCVYAIPCLGVLTVYLYLDGIKNMRIVNAA